jgi:hypothetical protein
MGLDIRFIHRRNIVCPKCGEVVGYDDVDCIDSGGRGWYPILESLGYYVPYEQRTEENDWYGKDMVLTKEQAEEVYQFTKEYDLCGSCGVRTLISSALYENDSIVVNADW